MHGIAKRYTETDASGNEVNVIVCKCGWKEKMLALRGQAMLKSEYTRHVLYLRQN